MLDVVGKYDSDGVFDGVFDSWYVLLVDVDGMDEGKDVLLVG